MRFVAAYILMIILSFGSCLWFPWWSIAIVCFLVSYLIPQRYFLSALTGFVSIFSLWFIIAFWLSFQNNHLLARKISLLILEMDSPFLLVMATALIGGLVGAMSSLSGSLLRGKP